MTEEQFLRLERLIGKDQVNLLHQKHVTVVGAGAVGGYAFESLVRSGVGNIRIVDFDTFAYSNINRQILKIIQNHHRILSADFTQFVRRVYGQCEKSAVTLRIL